MNWGERGRRLYQFLSLPWDSRKQRDGWKSNVSNQLFDQWASTAGLAVVSRTDRWGDQGQHRVIGSNITTLSLKRG